MWDALLLLRQGQGLAWSRAITEHAWHKLGTATMLLSNPVLHLQINQYIYVDKKLNTSGFSYFSQVRFVSQETGYISNTNGELQL